MRLFVAITVSEALRAELFALQKRLEQAKAEVRWVKPEQYHITVKFIGEAADDQLVQIAARMDSAAAATEPFKLDIIGLDRIESRGKVRVITAEVNSPDQRLTRLHRQVDQKLAGMGFDLDMRELLPHITLGRVQSNHGLNRLLRRLEHFSPDAMEPISGWEVVDVHLFQSTLTPEGSEYKILHTAKLGSV
ncbi:MAG TPA: RNA 2',3'-cyclic phosphodiesterase [Phycisphaerae bacterium]|nr:RNA 2',3'-cyclic phosphodiesterase [Phycisphaerae bacterium]